MKTRYRIMYAMQDLLNDYSYEQITISMITQKVPIARQGFYKLAWQPYEKDLFGILHDNIYRIYEKMICFQTRTEMTEEMAFLLDGYIIGCLHKLLEVLKKGEPLRIEEMTRLCIEMMPNAVREILEKGTYPASIIPETLE